MDNFRTEFVKIRVIRKVSGFVLRHFWNNGWGEDLLLHVVPVPLAWDEEGVCLDFVES